MSTDDGAHDWATLWREVLDLARWTPSPHNTQPWKVRLSGGPTAELFLDRTRALPDEDLTGCFVVAALGMFVESLSCLALNRNLRLDVEGFDAQVVRQAASHDGAQTLEEDSLVFVAGLTLSSGGGATAGFPGDPGFPDQLFLDRRTSRLTPRPAPIQQPALDELQTEASNGGLRVHLLETDAQVTEIMRLNLAAVVEDLNTPSYHREIVTWFRASRRDEQNKRDGLSARCMAMPGYEMRLLGRFPRLAKAHLVGWLVRAQYRRRLGGVPRLMVLDGPFWDAEAALKAGRCLMRLWLVLTRHGLRIHPFGNLITNETARTAFRATTGIARPWIVFRVGVTETPARSERLFLEEILVD